MRAIYLGGCWSNNIGNAFIDLGSLHLCKEYKPLLYSEWSPFYFGFPGTSSEHQRRNYVNTILDAKPDCIVFSGMVTCDEFTRDQALHFELFDKANIPVVLNGVGGGNYSDTEVSIFRSFLKQHKFAGFISRDDRSYQAYADLFDLSFKGIDCAFFLPDCDVFEDLKKLQKKYTVFTMDTRDPIHVDWSSFQEYRDAEADGSDVSCMHEVMVEETREKYAKIPRSFMAELPEEYVVLYSQAKTTFTTRVHACVATLTFGGNCYMFQPTPRVAVLETVGCSGLGTKWQCNQDYLAERKAMHLKGLSKIMGSL